MCLYSASFLFYVKAAVLFIPIQGGRAAQMLAVACCMMNSVFSLVFLIFIGVSSFNLWFVLFIFHVCTFYRLYSWALTRVSWLTWYGIPASLPGTSLQMMSATCFSQAPCMLIQASFHGIITLREFSIQGLNWVFVFFFCSVCSSVSDVPCAVLLTSSTLHQTLLLA
jgi:hypothetical protein